MNERGSEARSKILNILSTYFMDAPKGNLETISQKTVLYKTMTIQFIIAIVSLIGVWANK